MDDREWSTLSKNHSSDEESRDSDSPEIFQNKFSDTDDEVDQENAIRIVRNFNISKSNIPSPSFADRSKCNEYLDVKSEFVANPSLPRHSAYTCKIANDHEVGSGVVSHDDVLGFTNFNDVVCSNYTDSSYTCSEDEISISDEEDNGHWKPSLRFSANLKNKNKNSVPIENKQSKHVQSENLEGVQTDENARFYDHIPDRRKSGYTEHRQKYLPGIFNSKEDYRTEENLADESTFMDAHSASFSPKITHSSPDLLSRSYPGPSPLPPAKSAYLSDQGCVYLSNIDKQQGETNDTVESISQSETRFKTSGESVQHSPNCRQMQKDHFCDKKKKIANRTETGFYPYAASDGNNSSNFQHENQPESFGNCDFNTWNENWTTDDYIVCPNFLAGAPNEEEFSERNKTDWRKNRNEKASQRLVIPGSKVPRMFHRRIRKHGERDRLREHRFSHVAAMMDTPLTELFQFVKESGIDVTELLKQAGTLGLPLTLSCMQCYEGPSQRDGYRGHEQSPDGRCQKCGGQLQTLASMGNMISSLRKIVKENKFVIRDVYPDGNCMFGTVIDQLRVRGDFRYTVHTLRVAAVDYLRKNPTADDGTPLEMFLSNETWEDYLVRMSEDGQWGDHMVLNALTNVLQTRIVIYGGRSGETETILTPKYLGEESTKDTRSEPRDTGITTLHMGHLGQTHYVSFRAENWWKHIQERNSKALSEWTHRKFDPTQSLYIPVLHIDFILRHTFLLEHISYEVTDLPEAEEETDFTLTLVGPMMCKMVPDYNSQVESIAPDISIFFPSATYKPPTSSSVITLLKTPVDTVIQERDSEPRPLNLFSDSSCSNISHVRLLPVTPALWKGQTIQLSTGSVCLKAIDIECFAAKDKHLSYQTQKTTFSETLAFKCAWPEEAKEWIERKRITQRPEEHIIQLITSEGCHIVPVTSNENQQNIIDSYITADMINTKEIWSYSFAVADKKLSNCFSNSQRCCFLLFKSLIDFTCKNPPVPAALPKNIFFYACENIDETSWRVEPGRCLIVMLEKLDLGLRSGFLPHYFITVQNLLQDVPLEHIVVWSKTVEGILRQPVMALYFVMDMLDVTSTEIGAVFDDILEDIPKFSQLQSTKRSFMEVFIPASGTLIGNLIYQREYHFALLSLEDIHEQRAQFSKRPADLVEVLQMTLGNMDIGYRWCFGLYIDLIKGTCVTKEIYDTYDIVHVTEVFGPGLEEDGMPNTVVPACFSILYGDLMFPTVCAEVMLHASKKTLLAKCLRYYIETYKELAGDHIVFGRQGCQQMKLKQLHGLYITLLETYDDLGRPNEFRDLMPNFAMITELRQVHRGFHDLAWAWIKLGEPEKAEECCPCYNSQERGGMSSIIQQLFQGY